MAAIPDLDQIDSAKYLFLRELTEPRDNSLRVVVQEATDNPGGLVRPCPQLPESAELFTEVSPIESTESCLTFELRWAHYVAYLVTEEFVGSCGNSDDEIFGGKLFRIYTKSHFLDHVARDTGGHTETIRHFKLLCLNHLIDVAAYASPEIRVIQPVPKHPVRIQ
jgi:hypothetical protein